MGSADQSTSLRDALQLALDNLDTFRAHGVTRVAVAAGGSSLELDILPLLVGGEVGVETPPSSDEAKKNGYESALTRLSSRGARG